MLNDIDFDYPDLGLPNLVWAKSKTKAQDKPVKLTDKLAPLAFEAAKKFPKWTFAGTASWIYDDRLEIASLSVYENREKIGSIGLDPTRQGTKYTLSNERISNTRKRGSTLKTGDLKKALKLMAKTFGAKTVSEKLDEISSSLYSSISVGFSSKTGEYYNSWNVITKHLHDYVLNNFGQISAAAIAAGADPARVKKLPGLREEIDVTKKLHDAYIADNGWTVLINGSDYVVRDKGNCGTELCSSDTLPPYIKRSVGMLKLVEDVTFLRDVGFRLNENAFFILKEEANE